MAGIAAAGLAGCDDPSGRELGGVGPGLGPFGPSMAEETGDELELDEDSSTGTGSDDGDNGDVEDEDDSGLRFDLGASEGDGGTDLPPVECQTTLPVTVRDFPQSHPDFEYVIGVDPGIVQPTLGADHKPVYAGPTYTTNGQGHFDQWYRDSPGNNITIPMELPLTDLGNGLYAYDNGGFFPINGQGFGNEGNAHNYHFTLELHTQFTYNGGEVFTFRGDDDVFAYINGHLVIDLGGVHLPLEASVDLDAQAGALGIVPGGTYDLDFFFAERHMGESNFRLETTISCFQPTG